MCSEARIGLVIPEGSLCAQTVSLLGSAQNKFVELMKKKGRREPLGSSLFLLMLFNTLLLELWCAIKNK